VILQILNQKVKAKLIIFIIAKNKQSKSTPVEISRFECRIDPRANVD